MALDLLCAGAAKGLVTEMTPAFVAATGVAVEGTFGAVGAMQQKLAAGEPCDVIILTAAMIDVLEKDGRVLPPSAPLGRVRTGVAVRAGEALPDIHDGPSLRSALSAAAGILVPDPRRATAGIHFVEVLKRLAIYAAVESRLRTFPNGAAAMQELAQSGERGLIGCTQITEIKYTPGVALVGPLPPEFELATVYAAAVATTARDAECARRFVELLCGPASRAVRMQGGFEVRSPCIFGR
jgi:molybdate transport system substrate-binding protein